MARGIFQRIKDGWRIELQAVYPGACYALDSIGFYYIDVLLRHPGKMLSNTQIPALVGGCSTGPSDFVQVELDPEEDDSGFQTAEPDEPTFDKRLLGDIHRLEIATQQLQATGQSGAAVQLQSEIVAAKNFVAKNSDNHGRARKVRTDADRARELVSVGIRRAIAAVGKKSPELADYFRGVISITAAGAVYDDTETHWQLSPWHIASPDCRIVSAFENIDGQPGPSVELGLKGGRIFKISTDR